VALALLWPAAAAAQGLGDAAAREKQRRKTVPEPAEPVVFTNADLDERAREGSDAEGAAEEAAGASEAEAGSAAVAPDAVDPVRETLDREREERALQEREWRARFAESRARLAEAEARCWREVIRTEFYKGIPVQMKVQEFVETEEFRQAKADLANLEEEFRRTGLPPGWARE
jgi:hypothetical protein